jgi:nucleotide-binding universal stress UspA family protein
MGPAAYAAGEFAAGELSQWETRLEHDSVERLHALLPADANLACDPEYLVERNFVPEGILNVAASRKADLIVMGVNAASAARLSSHFPWNVAHEVICRAGCPVLTVRE